MVRTARRARKPEARVRAPAPSRRSRLATVPRVDLSEDPRALIVCRGCGRIQRMELSELDLHLLTELAHQHPDGWSVDRATFSLTGVCRRCREGPAVG